MLWQSLSDFLIHWVRRDRIVFLIAFAALALSALVPWYNIPAETLNAFEGHLYIPLIERLIMCLLSALSLLICLYGIPRSIPRVFLWIGILMTVLYPFLFTTFQPNATYIATDLLKQQQESVGHLEFNFPEVQTQWKQNIQLHPSILIDSIAPFSIKNNQFFQVSSFQTILTNGLGYRNSFFGLIGKGWGLGIFGLGVMFMGFYSGENSRRFQFFTKDLNRYKILFVATFCVLLIYLVIPNLWNNRINRHFALGNYPAVQRESQILQRLYPPFSGDTLFTARLGYSRYFTSQADLANQASIYGIEAYSRADFTAAEQYFEDAIREQPANFLLRGYLSTTKINKAVQLFNSSRVDESIEVLQSVLEIFPMHVTALYDLMVAHAVNGEFSNSATVAQSLEKTQEYFQLSSPSIQGQVKVHESWEAFHQNHLDEAWTLQKESTH